MVVLSLVCIVNFVCYVVVMGLVITMLLNVFNKYGCGFWNVICDGGIRRGTHILKALSLGANACSGGRLYLYALAAAGFDGVIKCTENLENEVIRGMKLMGCKKISDLSRKNIKFRYG